MANTMWLSPTKLNSKAQTEEEMRDQIRKYLKRSGIGDTSRLRKIMYYAVKHGGHFSFKELYEKTGRSVVTSDVDKLVNAGFLNRIATVGNKGKHIHLYESTIGNKPSHSHMQCVSCNKLVEFDDTLFHNLSRKMADHFKFEKHYFNIQVYGRCEDCCN